MAWAPDYITAGDLKAFVRIPTDDTIDDAQLALAISAASRAVDRACNRQFGTTTTTQERFYTATYDRTSFRWIVSTDDMQTPSQIAFDSANDVTYSGSITPVRLTPVNAVSNGKPFEGFIVDSTSTVQPTTLANGVRVTAIFGWASVPAAVKQATLLQASRFLARRESPFGVAGSPDVGSELRLLARLDPDVEVALAPYRRIWSVV
jgi:hypothetical protein